MKTFDQKEEVGFDGGPGEESKKVMKRTTDNSDDGTSSVT